MLWKLVDVLAILGAVGLVLLLGPGVIGTAKWKRRLFGNRKDRDPA